MHKRLTITVKHSKTGDYHNIRFAFKCDDELLINPRQVIERIAQCLDAQLKREYEFVRTRQRDGPMRAN